MHLHRLLLALTGIACSAAGRFRPAEQLDSLLWRSTQWQLERELLQTKFKRRRPVVVVPPREQDKLFATLITGEWMALSS